MTTKAKTKPNSAITVNGVEYIAKSAVGKIPLPKNSKAVLIRSVNSGVHFGYLESEKFTPSGKVVVLLNSRRVWQWYGAASLSQMAVEGVKRPAECKIAMTLPSIEIVDVIETIPLTEAALKNLSEVPEWRS